MMATSNTREIHALRSRVLTAYSPRKAARRSTLTLVTESRECTEEFGPRTTPRPGTTRSPSTAYMTAIESPASAARLHCTSEERIPLEPAGRRPPELWELAAVLESLLGQADCGIETRPDVLQADDRREFDKLCLIKVCPKSLHELVVDHRWGLCQRFGVFHDQALQRLEEPAGPPLGHRLDFRALNAVSMQHPVAEIHAPGATDPGGCGQVGQVLDPRIERSPLHGALLQLRERRGDRHAMSLGAEGIEHLAKPPLEEPFPDPVRPGSWGVERDARHQRLLVTSLGGARVIPMTRDEQGL